MAEKKKRRTPSPLTDAEKDRIRELHAAKTSLGGIAKDLDRPVATVSRFCKSEGLGFDTTRMAAAVKAHKDRAAEKRAVLEVELLDLADDIKAVISKHLTGAGVPESPRDIKDLAAAASALANLSLKITAQDAAPAGSKADDSKSKVDVFLDVMLGGESS